jgi:hypothetical protein
MDNHRVVRLKEFPTSDELVENTSQSPNIQLIAERRIILEEFRGAITGCPTQAVVTK